MGFSRQEYWSGERHINISTKLQYLKIYVALKIFSLLIYVMLSSFQSNNVVMNQREMVTYSSVLAWRIPGTGEPGGLLSMG